MRLLKPIDRLHAALNDPARRERAVLVSLALYTALWALYGTIAKSSQGLHPDMTEVIAWSRDLAWGYKHPPLAAAIVWLWFGVFPLAEWSYYLLAMLMPSAALWIVWRLTADYLTIEKRIAGLALLLLVPFFNFHALKFNVNTVLLPAWAATTWWFLRSYTTRSALYAALAGAGAAACMLGKYWSVFLLAGLVVAALIDKRRTGYFRSAAPWTTVAVGAVVLAPHLAWLYQHHFEPFAYAMQVHGDKSFGPTALAALGYLAGSFGYVAIPVIVMLIAARPNRGNCRRHAVAGRHRTPAGCGGVLGTLAASRRRRAGERHRNHLAVVDVGLDAAAGPAAVVSGDHPARDRYAPYSRGCGRDPIRHADRFAGDRHHRATQRPQPAAAQANLLAGEVERVWHETTPLPLRFVGGAGDLADGVITYAADRPRALPDMPQSDAAGLARSGLAIVCFAEDAGCRNKASAQAATGGASRPRSCVIFSDFPASRSATRSTSCRRTKRLSGRSAACSEAERCAAARDLCKF